MSDNKVIQEGDYVSDRRQLTWPDGTARVGKITIVGGIMTCIEWIDSREWLLNSDMIRVLPATPEQVAVLKEDRAVYRGAKE